MTSKLISHLDVKDLDEHLVEAINVILNPESAKTFYRPFLIGSTKVLIYGNPALMLRYSGLITSIVKTISDEPTALATQFTLTDVNIKAFLYLWLYMNGLNIPQLGSLLDNLILNEWSNYFNLYDDKFIASKIETVLAYNYSEYGPKVELSDEEKKLMLKLYNQYLIKCDSDLSTSSYCDVAIAITQLLDIKREVGDMLSLAEHYYRGRILDRIKPPLTDEQKKWVLRYLDDRFKFEMETKSDDIEPFRDLVRNYKRYGLSVPAELIQHINDLKNQI